MTKIDDLPEELISQLKWINTKKPKNNSFANKTLEHFLSAKNHTLTLNELLILEYKEIGNIIKRGTMSSRLQHLEYLRLVEFFGQYIKLTRKGLERIKGLSLWKSQKKIKRITP